MSGIGTGRDHSSLHALWADLEKVGGQFEDGLITEVELCRQMSRLAARREIEAEAAAQVYTGADEALRVWTGETGS